MIAGQWSAPTFVSFWCNCFMLDISLSLRTYKLTMQHIVARCCLINYVHITCSFMITVIYIYYIHLIYLYRYLHIWKGGTSYFMMCYIWHVNCSCCHRRGEFDNHYNPITVPIVLDIISNMIWFPVTKTNINGHHFTLRQNDRQSTVCEQCHTFYGYQGKIPGGALTPRLHGNSFKGEIFKFILPSGECYRKSLTIGKYWPR